MIFVVLYIYFSGYTYPPALLPFFFFFLYLTEIILGYMTRLRGACMRGH